MIDDPDLPTAGVAAYPDGAARWCVWAPKAARVELVLDPGTRPNRVPMRALARGFHEVITGRPEVGRRYAYALDGGEPLPDPLSRWQPDGVGTPSAVWYPERMDADDDCRGIAREDLVFYELHVGTFTPEGTFDAVIPRLPALRELGITAVELMPVAQFPGSRSWGYDGVFPFAPQNTYGGPEGLRRLVAACHAAGLAVFLDAVYNHFGPDGNVLPRFGPYFNDRYKTDWGPAINYDGKGCDPVRAMVLDNVRMWVRDYRFDGLRLDAADQIFDGSPRHILAEIAEVARAEGRRRGRVVHVFAENDMNDAPRFLGPVERRGYGLDGQWNDDYHHAAHVALTGETSGYYADFVPGPRALAKALERVFVNDGNYSAFRDRRHGTEATGFAGDRFIAFIQNHDQVGNRLHSDRCLAGRPASVARLAAGVLLLAPRLPLIFMGEEYGEANPFPFFCDYADPELIRAVREGRKAEFAHFRWESDPPDPVAAATRDSAVLSWSWEDPRRAGLRRLFRDLLALRRESPALRDFRPSPTRLHQDGAVLEVIRGGDAARELRIFFNFRDAELALPTDLASELPSFRSEVAAYGAEAPEADERFTHLRPHEFLIFGPLRPEGPSS